MNHYSTIADYCKAFAHPTPVVDYFDVRTFEEVQQNANDTRDIRWQTEPFRDWPETSISGLTAIRRFWGLSQKQNQ